MIQILSPGRPRPKPQETRQLRCPECGCVFAYDDEDTRSRDYDRYSIVSCPQEGCGEEVRTDRNKVVYRDGFRPFPGWTVKRPKASDR